jgi:Flp pilus assembly protein TadD
MALANCYFKAGLYEVARIGYEQTLKLVPEHQLARENLRVTLQLMGCVVPEPSRG